MEKMRKGYYPIKDVAGSSFEVGKGHKTTVVFNAPSEDLSLPDAEINVRRFARRMRIGGIERATVNFASAETEATYSLPSEKKNISEMRITPATTWASTEITIPVKTPKEIDSDLQTQITRAGNITLMPDVSLESESNLVCFAIPNVIMSYTLGKYVAETGEKAFDQPLAFGITTVGFYLLLNNLANGFQYVFNKVDERMGEQKSSMRFSLVSGYQLDRVVALNALNMLPTNRLVREITEKK